MRCAERPGHPPFWITVRSLGPRSGKFFWHTTQNIENPFIHKFLSFWPRTVPYMTPTQFFALYLNLLSNLHIFSFYPWIFIILTPYRIPYMTPTQFFALYLNLLSNLHIFSFYPWIFIILTPYRIPYMTPTQNFALYLNLLSNLIFHEIDFIDFPWESWKIYKISWNFAVKKMYALIPPSGDMKKPEKSM